MTIITALARPLLAVPFIASGVDAVRNAPDHVETVERVNPTFEQLGIGELSAGTITTLTRAVGAVRIVAGIGMALGKKPRIAALTLAGTELALGAVRNPVWLSEGEERKQHIAGLVSSIGLAGGALVAAGDRRGKPSLGWRLENHRSHKDDLNALAEDYEIRLDEQRAKLEDKIAKVKEKAKS
ncbi:DoxX family protein [Flaviflexus massiliensis]|uniref:DoxX family protein n=1 Tax=Flaviflexus massiliensis TaxID=1522309 RepID=UPI0006D55033|nr:DoxX family protein [Flaviflexus massiliensis]